jgi:plastocyanin
LEFLEKVPLDVLERQAIMRKYAIGIAVIAMLALAACGGSSSSSNTVTMAASTFVTHSLTVKAGTTVTFNDPSGSGGFHKLYTGSNGTFHSQSGAPSDLDSATPVTFNPGDSKSYVFSTPGTYTITCQIHPSMLVTITVTS